MFNEHCQLVPLGATNSIVLGRENITQPSLKDNN